VPRVILPELEPQPPASGAGRPERSWAPPSAPSNYALAIEAEAERSRRAPSDRWIRLCEHRYSPPPEGFECVVRLHDGRMYLACFLGESESAVEVAISGSNERRTISRDDVAGLVPVLRPHSFADRRLILDRQRRGEPGASAVSAWHHRRSTAGAAQADREHELERARQMLREAPSMQLVEIMRSTGLGDRVVRRLRAEVAAERVQADAAE
jgi:hypothetical protein